ncbi:MULTISPECIES: hypothetical protein [unclassified Burkholderia]|uniref:hypothetical protein n=1 Tax=unclassified Burkholderia TaxID=2613784 RepID=UPI0014209BC0|nr:MULTISPECIES: hypothetical protein [unclassified Burkholderia]NIE82340.1 hypothetical protein [Burkholderia sp. Tr-860]NIF95147.1 hypothetical protein [Burkholderia sp. Ax-1720]
MRYGVLSRRLAALGLALSASGILAAESGEEAVDLFPEQHWATLGRAAETVSPTAETREAASADVASAAAAASPPESMDAPFELAGEWRENGRRILVLDGMGQSFVLCATRCEVPGAILPGETITGAYRFGAVHRGKVVIHADDDTVFELTAPGMEVSGSE